MKYIDIKRTAKRISDWLDDEDEGGLALLFEWLEIADNRPNSQGYRGPYGWQLGGCWMLSLALETYFKKLLPDQYVERLGLFQGGLVDEDDDDSDYDEKWDYMWSPKKFGNTEEYRAFHALVKITGSPKGTYFIDSTGARSKKKLKRDLDKDFFQHGDFLTIPFADLKPHIIGKSMIWSGYEVTAMTNKIMYHYNLPFKYHLRDLTKRLCQVPPVMK